MNDRESYHQPQAAPLPQIDGVFYRAVPAPEPGLCNGCALFSLGRNIYDCVHLNESGAGNCHEGQVWVVEQPKQLDLFEGDQP